MAREGICRKKGGGDKNIPLGFKRMVSVKQSSARVRCAPHPDSQATLTALSFFPGAMGLDIGLAQAGFETCLASEID